MSNAETFGRQAATYAKSRPSYPSELFDWIKEHAPAQKLALDVGTGSGQATRALADRFDHVIATDISAPQIAAAPVHPRITYKIASAHDSELNAGSVDAVTVATALHWFDHSKFWKEVARVAQPGGIFCGWTYHRANVDPELEEYLLRPVLDVVEPYWAEGNRLSWRGYDPIELGLPFEPIKMPEFACELSWTAEQFADHLESWSAHLRARDDGQADVLTAIRENALGRLSSDARRVQMPLNTLAARIPIG